MFKWFTMLVTAACLCLFSSPIQCSLPSDSHDCVLKSTVLRSGAELPAKPLQETAGPADADLSVNTGALDDEYDRILNEIGHMNYEEAEAAPPTELEGCWLRFPHDSKGFPYIRFKGQFFSLVVSPTTSISGVFRLDGGESVFMGRWEGPGQPDDIDPMDDENPGVFMDLPSFTHDGRKLEFSGGRELSGSYRRLKSEPVLRTDGTLQLELEDNGDRP